MFTILWVTNDLNGIPVSVSILLKNKKKRCSHFYAKFSEKY